MEKEEIKEIINFETLDKFLDAVRKFAKGNKIDDMTLLELVMVVEELLVNIILYAYPKDKGNGSAELKLSMIDDSVEIEIIDEGIPFSPLSIVDPDVSIPLRDREEGGMGLFFVKKMTNSMDYERKGDKNIVTLTKKVKVYA